MPVERVEDASGSIELVLPVGVTECHSVVTQGFSEQSRLTSILEMLIDNLGSFGVLACCESELVHHRHTR